MAQSLAKIYIHLIFHIKTTSPKIRENDLERLHNYIGKLVKTTGCVEIKAGGVGDHVHVLFIYKAFALSGRLVDCMFNPGRCPGLGASALYLSLRPVTVGSGRMASPRVQAR